MCTNNSDYEGSEYILYFIISRSITDKDNIYGKFGNCKYINDTKRFMSYDANNPSYLRVSVPYDQTIMHKLGTQHEYLDNYINNKVLLKMSSVSKVRFKLNKLKNAKADWFFVTPNTAYNIMSYMIQFNESRHSHPIDSVKDCICFVRKLRILLENDIEYAIKCINDKSKDSTLTRRKKSSVGLNLNNEENPTNRRHSQTTPVHNTQNVGFLKIASNVNVMHPSKQNIFEIFMHRFYNKGGMVPIKNVKMHPEWTKEYETCITTKRVNMCKSCKNRAHKGCCSEYSSSNRVMIKMVIGWSESVSQ